jgi:biopolymer transport protein TolR
MRIRKNRRLRTQANRITDLSMTPLIDTALTLLIIFMITAPMLQNAIKVTLPQGQAKEDASKQQEELIVYVDKVGDFYIDKIKINRTDVIAHITKIVGDNKEKTVYVKADTAVSYGTVLELVDDIKFVGGIKYVALATQKHSQTAPSLG